MKMFREKYKIINKKESFIKNKREKKNTIRGFRCIILYKRCQDGLLKILKTSVHIDNNIKHIIYRNFYTFSNSIGVYIENTY